jgi:GT2 family glycosyltransferase
MGFAMNRMAVLVSCFNRKAITLAGLESLFRQRKADGLSVTVFLVDDASPDGTAAAVAERFPSVRLLHGDGSLWWVGAMRMAFAAAMAEGYDGYIWWNDDAELMDDALQRLVACALEIEPELGPAIIVGSMCDPETGKRTFGGWYKRPRGLHIEFIPVEPDPNHPRVVDTMNGNFVLIPSSIADVVGNMESKFRHRLADWDYGQRATKAGFPIVLTPGYVGFCKQDLSAKPWKDGSIPLAGRWKGIMSPRGMDPREWLLYTSRHYGWRWPLYFASPYVKTFFKGIRVSE